MTHPQALQRILDKAVDRRKVFGTSFALKKGQQQWQGASGNLQADQPYFIASTTKLFTTAIVLAMQAEGTLHLSEPLGRYLDDRLLDRLHVWKGTDYSRVLTIEHLLAHTSGLPDYFQDKGPDGSSLERALMTGQDRAWTLEDILSQTKRMKPLFAPGTPGKAHYSDTNFQLLGHLIECLSGSSYIQNCQKYIIGPLDLTNTWVYTDPNDTRPADMYYKDRPLHIPKAMCSFFPDGGIVSTSADMLRFVEAFFTGKLFPGSDIAGLQRWNRIFFPMRAGVGIHLFDLPWIFNPTGAVPAFIGHSGLSGALAFYSPAHDLFVAGTVNQIAHPDLSFRTMIKLTQQVLKS